MKYPNKSKCTVMHDLKASYNKVKKVLKVIAKEYFVFGENCQFYSHAPKLSDMEVIALSITAECLDIDSENLLWSKLQKDYSDLFVDLPHRTKFNKRRKRLVEITSEWLSMMSDMICEHMDSETLIIDSMPIPTCHIIRERRSKACRVVDKDEVMADKGKNTIMGGWYIGYKLHLITTETGVYKDLMVSSASVHDSYYLKILNKEHRHLRSHELLGDRGYIGKDTQLRLFDELDIRLTVPYRRNQKDYKAYDQNKKIKRKTIEVVFSQYCDEFHIKRNRAKRFDGLYCRIITKVTAKTFKQYINLINGKPINQTKHALAA